MIRLGLADLRESWVTWLGVSLAFIVTNGVLAMCMLFGHSVTTAVEAGGVTGDDIAAVEMMPTVNMVMSGLVALAVIGASTALVVSARRPALARLLLAGASPGQVVRFLGVQLIVVSASSALIGDALAVAATPSALEMVMTDRGISAIPMTVSIGAMLVANAACIALAVLGGLRQARAASRIPPVTALREATAAAPAREGWGTRVRRIAMFVVVLAIVVTFFIGYRTMAPELGTDALSQLMQGAAMLIPVVGLGLASILPWLVGPATRLWTAAIPGGPSWHLARHTVMAKADRMVRSILPVMFTTGLLFGMLLVTDTALAAFRQMGRGENISGATPTTLVTLIGLPLVVAVAGSVGNLIMMSGQRSAELALDGVVGATPRQQILVPVFEALILTVTACVLGLVMAATGAAFLASGLALSIPGATISWPWGMLAASALVCLAVTMLATVVPVLRSLREPAPRVIARLVSA